MPGAWSTRFGERGEEAGEYGPREKIRGGHEIRAREREGAHVVEGLSADGREGRSAMIRDSDSYQGHLGKPEKARLRA